MGQSEETGRFAVTMPLCKVWQDEEGELRFEGVASSTRLDRQQERMTPNAIRKMAQYANLDLLPAHGAGPLEELGVIEEAWADNDEFRVAGRLDRTNPAAQKLFAKALSGKRYGLSVGGRVTKAFWRYDEEAGRQVRYIDDVELDHVAVCRPGAAANPDTYLAALAKAADRVMGAARSLWPFGKGEADDPVGDELRELAGLRKDVEAALAEVREALDALAKGEAEEATDDPEPERGHSQALAGQESRRDGGMWGGVV